MAAGRVDGYYERGGQAWDWAAGRLIVSEAGGELRDLAGEPAGLVAAGPAIADELAASWSGLVRSLLHAAAGVAVMPRLTKGHEPASPGIASPATGGTRSAMAASSSQPSDPPRRHGGGSLAQRRPTPS